MDAKFILGNIRMSEWDNYISTLKKMNVEEMIKIRQAAYDRWNRTKK